MSSSKKRRLERERTQRREAIIRTARGFFTDQGYELTMVDKVALEAGYTKATIYNYFESKDDLFIAVVAKTFEKLARILEDSMKQPDVAYDLRSLGDAYLTFVEEYPDEAILFEEGRLGLVIGSMIRKEETKEPLTESEEEFREHQLKIQKLMTDIISGTIKKAGVEDKVDPFSVIMVLSSLASSIREIVMRGVRGNQTEEKTREQLSVLFNIIDSGLKHYEVKTLTQLNTGD
ncbi:MAG: TetR/AcrR family transcriptional regulator [Candidatus Thorarchaeota archaeon]|nr:MAG: TetR/AcrR family transcriptional regulator [Candidatus Thorarchaeota archaeon]